MRNPLLDRELPVLTLGDPLVILYTARSSGFPTSTAHVADHRASRSADTILHHYTCVVQGDVYSQLDIPVRRYLSIVIIRLTGTYRFATEGGYYDPIAVVCGVIQSCVMFYFIYVYYQKYPVEKDIESEPSRGPAEYNDQRRLQRAEPVLETAPTHTELEAPNSATKTVTPAPKSPSPEDSVPPEATAGETVPVLATPADPAPAPEGGSAFTVGDAEDAGADT